MQFDILYQELARGAEMIQALLAGITPDEARVKPAPEVWSVLEVVCHLRDEERWDFKQHLGNMLHPPDQPALPENPPNWDLIPHYNEGDLAQALNEFLAERQRSLAWLQALSAPDWETSLTLHFGPEQVPFTLKAGDALAAWVAHDNLHMRQLVELRRARLVRLGEPYNVEYAGGW